MLQGKLPLTAVRPTPPVCVRFYNHADYSGDASAALLPGNYSLAQLAALGVPAKTASSVQVPRGWTLTLFADDHFSGPSWSLSANTPNFSVLSPSASAQMSSCTITAATALVP
jgi:hypothetical protein